MNYSTGGIPAPPEAPTQAPEVPVEATLAPDPRAKRAPRRSTVVSALLLVVAIVGATLATASRAQIAGRLDASEASLSETSAELRNTTAKVSGLEARISVLEGDAAENLTEIDDTRGALTACQDLLELSVRYATRQPPGVTPAEIASMVVNCFEGKVPRTLF